MKLIAKKRRLKGRVVSNKMAKTLVVEVTRLKKDPKYLKYFKTSRRFKAHADNASDYVPGDQVLIEETRPLSKEKRWKVIQLVAPAKRAEVAPAEGEGQEETKP